MTDAIRVTRPGEGSVWDPDQKKYVPAPPVTVIECPARIRSGNPAAQDASAGGGAWAVDRTPTVHVPVSVEVIEDGMIIEVVAAGPRSASRVGAIYTVLDGHQQTDSTARRIPVQVVSRDVG